MPVEEIPPHVNGANKGVVGLLGYLRYNVTKDGPNQSGRQSRLKYIYEVQLITGSNSDNASYIAEFGEPESDKRYYKIRRFLQSNIEKYANRHSQGWLDCIEKWEDDIEWFVDTFGKNHGDNEPYFED